jgi:hypothetical protein
VGAKLLDDGVDRCLGISQLDVRRSMMKGDTYVSVELWKASSIVPTSRTAIEQRRFDASCLDKYCLQTRPEGIQERMATCVLAQLL